MPAKYHRHHYCSTETGIHGTTNQVMSPKLNITFFGLKIDYCSMTLTFTKEKEEKIKNLRKQLLTPQKISQREVVYVIGNTVPSFAVLNSPLYYRSPEKRMIAMTSMITFNYDT